MENNYWEKMNTIDAIKEQIESILDLMMCAGDSTDMRSLKTASEMCLNLFDEMMVEVEKMENELKTLLQKTSCLEATKENVNEQV